MGMSAYRFIVFITVASFLRIGYPEGVHAQVYAEPGFMESDDTIPLPDFVDGPHVQWSGHNRAEAVFFKYDSASMNVRAELVSYRVKKGGKYIRGYDFGPKEFYIQKEHPYPVSEIETSGKVLVIGDVHGEYDRLVDVLTNIGVINSTRDWSWGKGVVVFLGDLVDRGAQVTETLWFVKKLQHQAELEGGLVQVILGNHEIMDLTGDHRYLNKKYRTICEELDLDYFEFFSSDMELGRWLRSMNTMLRINDNLFVHGGLSPEMIDKKIPVDSVNNLVHQLLRADITGENFDILFFLTDNAGPYWYRGMLKAMPEYPMISEEKVREALGFYGVNRIFLGHTEERYFRINPSKSIYGIDVPIRYRGKTEQAILIDGKDIYRVFSDGTMVGVN